MVVEAKQEADLVPALLLNMVEQTALAAHQAQHPVTLIIVRVCSPPLKYKYIVNGFIFKPHQL